MKKFISLLLVLCLAVAVVPAVGLSATALESVVISDIGSVYVGDTFDVSIVFTNVFDDYIFGGDVRILFDPSAMEYVGCSNGSENLNWTAEEFDVTKCDDGSVYLGFFCESNAADFKEESGLAVGESATLKVTFKATAAVSNASFLVTDLITLKGFYDLIDTPLDDVRTTITIAQKVAKISSFGLALTDSIAINCAATIQGYDPDQVQVRFKMYGEGDDYDEEYVNYSSINSKGRYVYWFNGVKPYRMGDTLEAALVYEGEVISVTQTYSVKKYCTNMFSKTASALGMTEASYQQFVTFLADVLYYGAAAQNYVGYKTDKLVTEGVTVEPSSIPTVDSTDKGATGKLTGAAFKSMSMVLGDHAYITFKFAVDDATVLDDLVLILKTGERTVAYNSDDFEYDVATGRYMVTTPSIKAIEFANVFSATLTRDSAPDESTTATYSVKSYAYTMQGRTGAAAELVMRMYNYGLSAEAYVNQ